MFTDDLINMAYSQVGYHEKEYGTPVPALYPFSNAYDGNDNWTKYLNDLGDAQGQPWCGYFCYWCFWKLLGESFSDTDTFLHGISSHGAAVSSWANAFGSVGLYHEGDGYVPKPGDVVIFADTGIPWSHCEIVRSLPAWPTYINTIGGNTRNPDDYGDQSEGMWVAARTRYAPYTSGFHVKGYCEVDTTPGSGELPVWMMESLFYNIMDRKRRKVKP